MEKDYQKGKLYQWDGNEFVELEPSMETKIPVSEPAAEAVKTMRKLAQREIGMRPELSLTASAMLLAAATLEDMPRRVKAHGLSVYSASSPHAAESTAIAGSEAKEVTEESKEADSSASHVESSGTPATAYLADITSSTSNDNSIEPLAPHSASHGV